MISIIHLATLFNIAAAVSNGGSGVDNIINKNNNRHLQTTCADFNGDKWACTGAGCTYENKSKLCVGELPWETDPPTSTQPTTAQPTTANPTSSEPTKNPVSICNVDISMNEVSFAIAHLSYHSHLLCFYQSILLSFLLDNTTYRLPSNIKTYY